MPRVTPPKREPRYPDFPTIVHALAHPARIAAMRRHWPASIGKSIMRNTR